MILGFISIYAHSIYRRFLVYNLQGERLACLTLEELRDVLGIAPLGPRKVLLKELSYLLNDSMCLPFLFLYKYSTRL